MTTQTYRDKLDLLIAIFSTNDHPVAAVSIPQAAKAIGIDEDTLRSDPSLPVMMFGTRRKISLDELARWMISKENKRN